MPLMVWFRAIWNIVIQKFGADAKGLSRILGIYYTTSWNLLHKLRRAMVRFGREMLSGIVEIDETFIGGFEEGKPGRGADKKVLVIIGVEICNGQKIGGIRMKSIESASSENLLSFIQENVEAGSEIITDGWAGYSKIQSLGYNHQIKKISEDKEALPHVHLIISLLKRWLLGTYQGSISQKQLDYYLDEYIFRFNRRKSAKRGKLFHRLIEQAVQTHPVTRTAIKNTKNFIADDIGKTFSN
jgi:transposase-like protein